MLNRSRCQTRKEPPQHAHGGRHLSAQGSWPQREIALQVPSCASDEVGTALPSPGSDPAALTYLGTGPQEPAAESRPPTPRLQQPPEALPGVCVCEMPVEVRVTRIRLPPIHPRSGSVELLSLLRHAGLGKVAVHSLTCPMHQAQA